MRLEAIPIGDNPPEDVNVIVEVPIGGEPIKYEMDKAAGTLFVDRFLHTPMRYPGNYGFVPHTLSDDGDPIDVLVANTRPIVPGAVHQRAAGRRADDGGRKRRRREDHRGAFAEADQALRRTCTTTPTCRDITTEQIQHFFEHYKDLEPGKWVQARPAGAMPRRRASSLPRRSRARAGAEPAYQPDGAPACGAGSKS